MDGQTKRRYDAYLKNYSIGKVLGIGSFSKVRVAVHTITGQKVAIKILNRKKIKNLGMEETVKREMKILRIFMHLWHPHIIRLYEIIETPSEICVVMEYVKNGELFDYIVEKGRVDENQARRFFQQIISGVECCHKNMVSHRDLKPENLLLDLKYNVKLADFGLSNIMRDGHFLRTSCGSLNYAAPEVIANKLYAGPEVDVWGCGIILYALLCGFLPFDDENISNLYKKIKGGIYTLPNHLSVGAKDIIPRMLIVDPMKRISISEICRHPWFRAFLPRYLALSQIDSIHKIRKIDKDCLLEVVNMGFHRDQLVESLMNKMQNQGTVAYYLLLDNRCHSPGAYLEAEFTETKKQHGASVSSTSHMPTRYMDQQGVGVIKYSLGLKFRAFPRDIIMKVLKVLQDLNIGWKKIGDYNMKCRWFPFHQRTLINVNVNIGTEMNAVENDPHAKSSPVVKFELQLYKTTDERYLLDIQKLTGPHVLFLDLCADLITKLRP